MATVLELEREPQVETPIRIIDADTHFSEPHDLWTSRAPAALLDRVPQVKVQGGTTSWVIDGYKVIGEGAKPSSAILKDGVKPRGLAFYHFTMADVHAGSSQVEARLAYMDENNVQAQIIYPNLLGFGGQKAAQVDPALRLVCTQIYNDAMAEMQAESGGRICGMAMLPWWDIGAAVAEVNRAAAMGLRGININSDPQNHDGLDGQRIPDLAQAYWNPLWEACVAHKMPVNFHIGASESTMDWFGDQGWPGHPHEMRFAVGSAMLFVNNGKTLANLIFSGICDRYPNLKFVSVESGLGWLPFFLEALDYQYSEAATKRYLERKPSDYFRSNFYACFWFERRNIVHSIRALGIENCMFETDFPHPTCLYPMDNVEGALEGLTREEKTRVLALNAAQLYRLDY